MIVVDEHAETKLIKTLEAVRHDPGTSKCLHFKFPPSDNTKIRQSIIDSILKHDLLENPQLYLCQDGDMVVLASKMPIREAKELILDVATKLDLSLIDDSISLYELNLQANKLIVMMQEKIDSRQRQLIEAKRKEEEEFIERKKHALLNVSLAKDLTSDISSRRTGRPTPELMIIEDDIFSRRLVENVLNKQYHLTGLGSAEAALDTYVRLAPDILFLDINLPDVSGHELLEKIIAIDPHAYIIMLSANSDKENILFAINKGAKGFIAKPFTREKIFQYIERCSTIKR